MDIKVLMDLFDKEISELTIKKDIKENYILLSELKDIVYNFNAKENEFLQKFYINLINEKELKILDYSENFNHAEYFFIDKFFDNNLKIFYGDFILKDNLLQYKNSFLNMQNVSVNDVLSGYDKSIVSLYVYIENLTKHYGDFCQDREMKNKFKMKIIAFFDHIYRLFKTYSIRLREKYFNLIIYNHPMILVELIKSCINTKNENETIYTFTQEHRINQDKKVDSFEIINKELFLEFVSIISMINPNIQLLVYNTKNISTLSYIYKKEISNFEEFKKIGFNLIKELEVYTKKYNTLHEKLIFSGLFLKYISKFSNQNLAKNTLFISTGSDLKHRKIKELIEINNIPKSRFEHISMHQSYEYKDIMDGFFNQNFKNGILKNICKKAINDEKNDYYLLISNINHCDILSVFGESLELLCDRYSQENKNAFISTKYSNLINNFEDKEAYSILLKDGNSVFAIPENLYIIATFDLISGEQSLPLSITENFECIKLECNYTLIKSALAEIKNSNAYIKITQKLNSLIKEATDNNDLEIDHYIFLEINKYIASKEITNKSLEFLFEKKIEPILISIFNKYLPKQGIRNEINSAKAIFDISRW